MSPSQAMDMRKKEAISYHSDSYEDYEDGKKRDKRQKKLKEWTGETINP